MSALQIIIFSYWLNIIQYPCSSKDIFQLSSAAAFADIPANIQHSETDLARHPLSAASMWRLCHVCKSTSEDDSRGKKAKKYGENVYFFLWRTHAPQEDTKLTFSQSGKFHGWPSVQFSGALVLQQTTLARCKTFHNTSPPNWSDKGTFKHFLQYWHPFKWITFDSIFHNTVILF